MFSMLPTPRKLQFNHYTPQFSSPLSSSPLATFPLSPRNANSSAPIFFNHQDEMMSSPTRSEPSKENDVQMPSNERLITPPSRKENAFSKRATKPNPLLHGREDRSEGRETRRKLFLKKVREGAEEKRWKDRGGDDEIMRMLWVAEERRREERRRREVLGLGDEEIEELSLDEVMANEVAMQEEQELEALLIGMNQEESEKNIQQDGMAAQHQQQMDSMTWGFGEQRSSTPIPQDQPPTPTNTNYGSDDEEYDNIFMDVIQEENRILSQRSHHGNGAADQDMMDMS